MWPPREASSSFPVLSNRLCPVSRGLEARAGEGRQPQWLWWPGCKGAGWVSRGFPRGTARPLPSAAAGPPPLALLEQGTRTHSSASLRARPIQCQAAERALGQLPGPPVPTADGSLGSWLCSTGCVEGPKGQPGGTGQLQGVKFTLSSGPLSSVPSSWPHTLPGRREHRAQERGHVLLGS